MIYSQFPMVCSAVLYMLSWEEISLNSIQKTALKFCMYEAPPPDGQKGKFYKSHFYFSMQATDMQRLLGEYQSSVNFVSLFCYICRSVSNSTICNFWKKKWITFAYSSLSHIPLWLVGWINRERPSKSGKWEAEEEEEKLEGEETADRLLTAANYTLWNFLPVVCDRSIAWWGSYKERLRKTVLQRANSLNEQAGKASKNLVRKFMRGVKRKTQFVCCT